MQQRIEDWKPGRLIDYARNPRKNDHAVDRIAAAIKEFGFRVPILAKSDIENHTKPGEIMYEPFSGSGSQIIAAEQTARRCFAMELSANYCDVAVRRWQAFTGQRATHATNGVLFPA